MTNFGEDYEQLENCGVEFDSNCLDPKYYFEDLGECEEDDAICISEYRRRQQRIQSQSMQGSLISRNSKTQKSEKGADTMSRQTSITSKNGAMNPTLLSKNTPDPGYFQGLPKNYYEKRYRPDYPTDLMMKQICAPKQGKRRTLGAAFNQPKAVFIPSRTALESQEKSIPTSPAVAGTKKKSVVISNKEASISAAAQDQKGIFMDEPSPLEQNRLPPPVLSSSDEIIIDWIEGHNIQMMFEYFLGLCVIHQPDNPWTFISSLCGKMMEARNNLGAFDSLPRVLTPEHTEAIFRIYDRIENGSITVHQYKSAMEAMGLSIFSRNPEGWEDDAISKDTFIKEATEAIDDLLRSFMIFEKVEGQEDEESDDEGRSKSAGIMNKGTASDTESFDSYSTGESDETDNAGDSPVSAVDNEREPPISIEIVEKPRASKDEQAKARGSAANADKTRVSMNGQAKARGSAANVEKARASMDDQSKRKDSASNVEKSRASLEKQSEVPAPTSEVKKSRASLEIQSQAPNVEKARASTDSKTKLPISTTVPEEKSRTSMDNQSKQPEEAVEKSRASMDNQAKQPESAIEKSRASMDNPSKTAE